MKTTDDKNLIVTLETMQIMNNIISIQQSIADSINFTMLQHNLINNLFEYIINPPLTYGSNIELSGLFPLFDDPED